MQLRCCFLHRGKSPLNLDRQYLMAKEYAKFTAAAVQSEPVYLGVDAMVDKACDIIDEAARHGARLVAFPEAYLPRCPIFAFMGDTNYVCRHC
jgi:cyanide dihydratase